VQVRYVGVSNETSYGVSEFVHAAKAAGLPRIQTIQNVYHLLQRGSYETDLAETCRWVEAPNLISSTHLPMFLCAAYIYMAVLNTPPGQPAYSFGLAAVTSSAQYYLGLAV
jgi:hypothetical protein